MAGMTMGIKTSQMEYKETPPAVPATTDETTWQRSQGAILKMLMAKDLKAKPNLRGSLSSLIPQPRQKGQTHRASTKTKTRIRCSSILGASLTTM